jgi:hypothetical protein
MTSPVTPDYTPRVWRTVAVNPADRPKMEPVGRELNACDSTSEYAERAGDHARTYFLFDHELVAAGFPRIQGGSIDRLTESWRGYPEGTRIMVVYMPDPKNPIGVKLHYVAEVTVDYHSSELVQAGSQLAEDFILVTRRNEGETLRFAGSPTMMDDADSGLKLLAKFDRSSHDRAKAPRFVHSVELAGKSVKAIYRLFPTDSLDLSGTEIFVTANTRPDGGGVTVMLAYDRKSVFSNWNLEVFDFDSSTLTAH